MRHHNKPRLPGTARLRLGAVLAVLCWTAAAPGQRLSTDPVINLRNAFRTRLEDRAAAVRKRAAELRNLSELRRALELPQWQSEGRELTKADKDLLRVRNEIGARFKKTLKASVHSRDPRIRLAVAKLIGGLGTNISALESGEEETGFTRSLVEELVHLSKDRVASVRVAAARSLGRINPDPAVAVPSLQALLTQAGGSVSQRRAAAAGLYGMVKQTSQKGGTQGKFEFTSEQVIAIVQRAVPAAGRGLFDSDPQVRGTCVATVQQAASALADLVPRVDEDSRAFSSLVVVVARQGYRLAGLLDDSSPGIRILVRRALEDMAFARLRILRQRSGLPDQPERLPRPKPPARRTSMRSSPRPAVARNARKRLVQVAFQAQEDAKDDPLGKSLTRSVEKLARGLSDPDVRVRRASMDFLEMMGRAARPAAPALIAALKDPDVFVRWAAARTLTKIGLETPEEAVPGLACLLGDEDLDVRLAAAATLETFGSRAAGAVPALIKTIQTGDPEIRLAAMRTLLSIGKAGEEAIPVLISLLANKEPRVRAGAAETLGKFGPAARSAADALRKAMDDPNGEVRKAASEALLSVLPAE